MKKQVKAKSAAPKKKVVKKKIPLVKKTREQELEEVIKQIVEAADKDDYYSDLCETGKGILKKAAKAIGSPAFTGRRMEIVQEQSWTFMFPDEDVDRDNLVVTGEVLVTDERTKKSVLVPVVSESFIVCYD